ncbi:MAG: hypothetical protein ACOVS5_03300, partial [Oligoflexus sp.]
MMNQALNRIALASGRLAKIGLSTNVGRWDWNQHGESGSGWLEHRDVRNFDLVGLQIQGVGRCRYLQERRVVDARAQLADLGCNRLCL